MTTPAEKNARAWQPLTPRGAAAFARAPLWRLLAVQLFFAALSAAAVVWFLDGVWFPVIREAIRQLPPQGEIRSGNLNWHGQSPQLLVESRFLTLTVDLDHSRRLRVPAHIQVEFGRNDVRFISLFGYAGREYPGSNKVIAFNRTELEPWWGAWEPPLLWIAAGAVLAGLIACWAALATMYSLPLWLGGYFANRALSWRGSWKLGGAALMPGALLLSAGILLYGSGVLDLVQFIAIGVAHIVLGWIYASWCVGCLPRHTPGVPARGNPFVAPPAAAENDAGTPPEGGSSLPGD